MRSHTVPRLLLDQFAYDDSVTKSRRLWCYEKGKSPFVGASPKTATRIEGHFSDPANEERERRLETRLNEEFENPVHQFLPNLRYQTFVMSRLHVRQLTRYITLLWNRSQNRRGATKEQIAIAIESTRSYLTDDEKLRKIAARWTMEIIRLAIRLSVPSPQRRSENPPKKMVAIMQTKGTRSSNPILHFGSRRC